MDKPLYTYSDTNNTHQYTTHIDNHSHTRHRTAQMNTANMMLMLMMYNIQMDNSMNRCDLYGTGMCLLGMMYSMRSRCTTSMRTSMNHMMMLHCLGRICWRMPIRIGCLRALFWRIRVRDLCSRRDRMWDRGPSRCGRVVCRPL